MRTCPRCQESFGPTFIGCKQVGCPMRMPMDPNLGKTVGGRYRLISRLGAGGMSTVYLARHVLIERLVAVKTLRRDLARETIQRDRFLREARAVNRVNHDNIVEITDFGETDDGLVFLVMEYVPGDSLLSAMANGPMSTAHVLDLALQVGSALARAHQMGVVHRDLKPENILLVPRKDSFPHVKLLDFGIAKIMDAPSLTGSQQIFGTPGYIAPEYIKGNELDGRADLYSLGVILYEVATLALPFDYEYPGDLLVKHVTDPPVPPRERRPEVDPCLEQLILRCLEKEPDARFRDAYHFVEEVTRCRERVGSEDSWGALGVVQADAGSARPEVRQAHDGAPQEAQAAESPPGAHALVDERDEAPTTASVRSDKPRRGAFSLDATVIEGGAGVPPTGSGSPSAASESAPAVGPVAARGAPDDDVVPAPRAGKSSPLLDTLVGPGVVPAASPAPDSVGELALDDFLDRTVGFDTIDDTVVETAGPASGAARPPTSTYERPRIPSEPNDVALSMEIELPPGVEVPRTADSVEDIGLLGTRRWRERFTALSHAVEEIGVQQRVPVGIHECLTLALEVLREISERVEGAEARQQQMEELTERARRVRSDFGGQQDRIAQELSLARGKVIAVRARFSELAEEHERAAESENRGEGTPGRALGLRHAIRDVEDALGVEQRLCLTLEAELRGVHTEMESWSEEHERELASLAETSTKELTDLEDLIERLRGPLDRVEAFVRSVWGR
ncbi:MAG: protein kinase [Sandaracinaceae bacterium]|nr:protein kinase [Sandaracinaceae bacterium]